MTNACVVIYRRLTNNLQIYLPGINEISMSTGGLALYWNLTALTSAHNLNARYRVSLMPCRKFQGTWYHADFKFHVIGMRHHLLGEPRRKRRFVSKRSSLLFLDEVFIFISISYSLGIRSYGISRCLEMRGFH